MPLIKNNFSNKTCKFLHTKHSLPVTLFFKNDKSLNNFNVLFRKKLPFKVQNNIRKYDYYHKNLIIFSR